MTKDDTRDLWKLLELFRPGDSRLKNQSLIAAWALVLEPYSRDEVREAVAAHFRESPYWPDVTDITKRCTAPITPPPPAKREARYQPGEAERLAGDQLSAMVRDYHRRLHEAGLKTLGEARREGMTCDEWWETACHIQMEIPREVAPSV